MYTILPRMEIMGGPWFSPLSFTAEQWDAMKIGLRTFVEIYDQKYVLHALIKKLKKQRE